jgi:type VI secretion system secreted protein VgrG
MALAPVCAGAPFSLWLENLAELPRVVRFTGTEAVSALYEFTLDIAAGELDFAQIVGRGATLQLDGLGPPRLVHGEVASLETSGQSRRHQLYRLTLVPRLARLQHRRGCRVFQNQTTPEVVAAVLRGAGFTRRDYRFDLAAAHAPRNYCVQYRESDLAFISRLLEEDGIFYFFEHGESRATLVLADHPEVHPAIPGESELSFHAGGQRRDREHVTELRLVERVRPGKVSLRDFDFHEPTRAMDVSASAGRDDDLEVYDYPGEFQDPGNSGPHQGRSLARLRLEEQQVGRRQVLGAGDCMRLIPGHHFTTCGHRRPDLNAALVLTRVTHTGAQPQALDEDGAGGSFHYSNQFECIPRHTPLRPERATPRPFVRGVQPATVVGPAQEEIHVDEQGRVLVQFHWDREGRFDERSSCWVRVSQGWAGAGWGTMFIPRVGHEVLVDFIEGDPDRPIITGRVYHADNATPYRLPDEKTKSTIKSESSPGGGGFNELRFEDRKGGEEVYLHAQRDLHEVVLHDNVREVRADQTFTVGGAQTFTITGDRRVTVTRGDESLTVRAGSSTTTIEQHRHVTVRAGNSALTVASGTHTLTAGRAITAVSQTEGIELRAHAAIALTAETNDFTASAQAAVAITARTGPLTLSGEQAASLVSRASTLHLAGKQAVSLVSTDATLTLGSKEKATLASSDGVDVVAANAVSVRAPAVGVQGKTITLTAADALTLQVGQSAITLRADGITVSAPKISSAAIGMHEISGALIKIN